MGNNSTPYGKIQYVEPNDILEKKEYGEGSFNITHPYEDYCISVDLEVTVPDRMGTLKTETHTISYANTYSGDTVSFFSGENGLLSTTPGSMTYKDIMNGDTENNRESLGITNIHISYNSYFYPTVTINFSDVRAESLMGVKEENYRRNEMNNASSEPVYTEKVKTFFESLFAFPYPEFKLRVKGFYGKKVEYSLVVSNFRSSFNNQTGNFDVTVEFIGKMYGVYTDIPMSYLMIAPYCAYGSNNNGTVWEQKNFTFGNDNGKGTPIPKFIELKEKIIKTNAEINSSIDVTINEEKEKINDKKNLLTEISNAYRDFKNEIFKPKRAIGDTNIDVILCPIDGDGKCEYLYQGDDNQLLTCQENLYGKIKKFNEIGGGDKLPDIINNSKIGKETISFFNAKNILNAEKLNDGTIKTNLDRTIVQENDDWVYFHNSIDNPIRTPVKNFLENEFKYEECGTTKSYVIIDGWRFKEKINSLSKNYEDKLKEIEDNYKSEVERIMTEKLGFMPSIKNVFMILMAHLDTFITIYSRFVQNVTGVNERKVSEYGDISIFSDIINSNNALPPFPAIKDIENNEFCYPTFQVLKRQMEETHLIDRLLDGTQTFSEEADSTRRLSEQFNDSSLDFIPTCLTDLIVRENPYETVFKTNNSENCLDWIYTYFGYRCAQKLIFEENKYSLGNIFGELEAYNFWRVNQNLTKKNIDILKNETSKSFIDFITNKKDEVKCYSNNEWKKILEKSTTNDVIIPASKNYYAPAVIGRDEYGFNTFISDRKDGNCEFVFMGEDIRRSKPYGFIKTVNEETLDEWENILNNSSIGNANILIDSIKTDDRIIWFGESDINSSLNEPQPQRVKGNIGFTNTYKSENEQLIVHYNNHDKNCYQINKLFEKNEDGELLYDYLNLDNITLVFDDNNIYVHMPIFLDDNLQPVNFLKCFPIDWEEVSKLKEINGVVKIPYVLQLFIGCIMCTIKDLNNYDKIKNFIRSIVPFNIHTGLKYILHTITTLTRKNKIHKYTNYDLEINSGNDSINEAIKKIYSLCVDDSVDILGLKNKYKEWVTNKQPGGFIYFKEKYKLTEGNLKKDEDNNSYIEYEGKKITGETKSERFKNLVMHIMREHKDDYGDKKYWHNYNSLIHKMYSGIIYQINSINEPVITLSFNHKYEAYEHLNNFVKKYVYLVLPYKHNSRTRSNKIDLFETHFNSFKSKLLELYGENVNNEIYSSNAGNIDHKLAMYQTLKNLYDKHFNTIVRDEVKYHLTSETGNTEFSRFHFVDSFFNDLSDDFLINADYLVEILDIVTDGYASGKGEGTIPSEMSVYSFMSMICQKHNMMLMATPVFNNSFTTKEGVENLEKMFTPLPYVECINDNVMSGPSYICFYPHKASHHLDNPSSQYPNDGFNITDLNGTAEFNGPLTIEDLENSDENKNYIIPAFGVEYGTQKQSIFKNININMDNPQTTEVAVATQFALANRNNEDMTKLRFEGQDLFKIYSNYSFTCNVEMMGCAQIQPLMYFQLNNIPMFRGAYIIIQVEHDITPGNMTTSFKGVRLNRTKIPIKSSGVDAKMMNAESHPGENKSNDSTIASSYNGPDLAEVRGTGVLGEMDPTNYTYDDMKNTFGSYFTAEAMSSHDSREDSFNDGNPELRRLLYFITRDAKEMGRGVIMSRLSSKRVANGSSKNSEHMINIEHENYGLPFRDDFQDYSIRYKKNVSLRSMGCAVDLHGTTTTLSKNKEEGSIILFNLIATKYTNYIYQLIWEKKEDYNSSDNISNCLHFSSFGEYKNVKDTLVKHNKTPLQIYVTSKENGWSSWPVNLPDKKIDGKAPTNLPPRFIYTLYLMRKQGVLYDYVYLNNFKKWNSSFKTSDLTEDILKRWCKELKVI